ncbi:MAG TPA: VWA domain-containing protein, partial [Ignavibacteria bacterium]|nr:VWA domain-containing protein [Ignavibacteria bacterium]
AMKKQAKKTILPFLAVITILTALSISAYLVFYNTGEPVKVQQTNAKNINSTPHANGKIGAGPIKFTTSLDNNYYYDKNSVYLYIDLEADKIENYTKTPMNISIVIDRSGSMSEKNKLEYVKKAVEYLIDEAGSDDYVSIVTYDDYVDVLQKTQILNDKYELRQKVNSLKPGGFTNLSGGMFEGYDQVNSNYMRGYVNKVFLLSDGLANRGITDRYKLSTMVKEKNRKDGITISTFGVGTEFNENMMTDIAEYGRGNYYYIKNSSDIPEIFATELKGMKNLVGQNTKMKVRFPKENLKLSKVFGYPYEVEGDYVTIDFKDVFSSQKKSVLLKFDVIKNTERKLVFENELTYEDVTADFRLVTESNVNRIEQTSSLDKYNSSKNESVIQNVAMFEANDIMEEALRNVDDGNYDRAKELMSGARNYMDEQLKTVSPSPEMKRQSDNIDRYSKDVESVEKKTEEERNEMQKSGKYDNYNTRKKNE